MAAVCWRDADASMDASMREVRGDRPDPPIARAFTLLREWRRRIRDREKLAALDDRMLSDIGLTRAEAEFLSGKPFWRE